MKRRIFSVTTAGVIFSIVALLAALIPAHRTLAKVAARPTLASGHSCVVAAGSGDGPFIQNFNIFTSSVDFATGAMYEPLFFYSLTSRPYYWLASKLQWSKDVKTLTITVRQGVKWSDGKPLTNKDVLFTLTAGKINTVMDKIGYEPRSTSNISSINLVGKTQVAIHFLKRDSTFLGDFNNVYVIPEHIWSKISDVTKFTNPNPVSTGPFNRILKFNAQQYVLGKNPNYWQKGRPYVSCIERLGESGNDAALLAMAHGDADWTHNFVPDIQKVYTSLDPTHFHYWYGAVGSADGLFFDDTKYPYSLVDFRKAVSMALDRKTIVKEAEYGYAPPSDGIGIAREFPKWIDPKLAKQSKALVTYNPAAAKALLVKDGFTYKDGNLIDPHGNAVSFDMHVIAGWTDWVLQLQIEASELQAIGINANLKTDPDWGTWWPLASTTQEVHLIWTYSGGGTPYTYLNSNLSPKSYAPSGKDESFSGDFGHFQDAGSAPLLSAFRKTASKSEQKAIVYKLEAMFLKDVPFVPVFIGNTWYTYSTKYFTGWPSQKDPYALQSSWGTGAPDVCPILTHLKPVK